MSMKVYDCEQYSPEWWDARRGVPTASKLDVLLTATLNPVKDDAKGLLSYAAELAADLHAGFSLSHEEGFKGNAITDRGLELEPEAAANYAMDHVLNDDEVSSIGFVTNHGAGCSPDRLVGADGLLEIKCPLAKQFTLAKAAMSKGQFPGDYFVQCQVQMMICERKWCDLYVYHPKLGSARARVEPEFKIQRILQSRIGHLLECRDEFIAALQEKAA